jgi:hypothetical protein
MTDTAHQSPVSSDRESVVTKRTLVPIVWLTAAFTAGAILFSAYSDLSAAVNECRRDIDRLETLDTKIDAMRDDIIKIKIKLGVE